jgi:outer membrane protein TolC
VTPSSRHESIEALEALALRNRPEIRAGRARILESEAGVELADRQYYPDLDVMAAYDSMQVMPEHRWMVGIAVNVPLQLGRRRAAEDEAVARAARARAEDSRARDAIRVEVTSACRRVEEARLVIDVYRDRLLPASRDQVAAAQAGFTAGRNDFLALIAAERTLRTVELRFLTAKAELHRRLAQVDRVVGRIPGLPHGAER